WSLEMARQEACWLVEREWVMTQNLLFFLSPGEHRRQDSDVHVRPAACFFPMLRDFHLYIVANVFEHVRGQRGYLAHWRSPWPSNLEHFPLACQKPLDPQPEHEC